MHIQKVPNPVASPMPKIVARTPEGSPCDSIQQHSMRSVWELGGCAIQMGLQHECEHLPEMVGWLVSKAHSPGHVGCAIPE